MRFRVKVALRLQKSKRGVNSFEHLSARLSWDSFSKMIKV